MSRRAPKAGERSGEGPREDVQTEESGNENPRDTYIRELLPAGRHAGDEDLAGGHRSPRPEEPKKKRGFSALRSVARFLTLESYRSLPKHDKLPDLDPTETAATANEDRGVTAVSRHDDQEPAQAAGLLDWDEMDESDFAPSPYRLYLFDERIRAYLEMTRQQLNKYLLHD